MHWYPRIMQLENLRILRGNIEILTAFLLAIVYVTKTLVVYQVNAKLLFV